MYDCKVPDLENPKHYQLAQNSAQRMKRQRALETPSGLEGQRDADVLKQKKNG